MYTDVSVCTHVDKLMKYLAKEHMKFMTHTTLFLRCGICDRMYECGADGIKPCDTEKYYAGNK